MKPCDFTWHNGWGDHTCKRVDEHLVHRCECDAELIRRKDES